MWIIEFVLSATIFANQSSGIELRRFVEDAPKEGYLGMGMYMVAAAGRGDGYAINTARRWFGMFHYYRIPVAKPIR
jgi:hypothetical protein